jgi:hypothetical protein
MANVAIGEIAVHDKDNGQSYLLRPSFLAMQKIGDPAEIEAAVEFCHSAQWKIDSVQAPNVAELAYCLDVVQACADRELPADIFGSLGSEGDKVIFIPGRENQETLVIIACALLRDGVSGKPDPARTKHKKKLKEKYLFDPLDFVAVAMSPNGFNKSSSDAWQMTMIEFQRVFDATFPMSEKEKNAMTEGEARDLLKRLGKI